VTQGGNEKVKPLTAQKKKRKLIEREVDDDVHEKSPLPEEKKTPATAEKKKGVSETSSDAKQEQSDDMKLEKKEKSKIKVAKPKTPKKVSGKTTKKKKKSSVKKKKNKTELKATDSDFVVEDDELEQDEEMEPEDVGGKKERKKRYKGSKYDPINDAGWDPEKEKLVPYRVLAAVWEKIGATTKRLEKIELLANLIRSVIILAPEELYYVVYLCSNKIAPPYAGLELGIGDTIILKALQQSTGRKLSEMKKDMQKLGDLGTVALQSRSKQRTLFPPKPLTAKKVFDSLIKIAKVSGNRSGNQKIGYINNLFVSSKGSEAKYIARHLTGKMKLGLAEQTVFASLGRACSFTPPASDPKIIDLSRQKSPEFMVKKQKSTTELIKQVFSEMPNYEKVINSLIEHGLDKLHDECHLTVGVPVGAMLAKPTKGVQEILERFKDCRFTLEYKYDGERAQIHYLSDGTISIFSRNSENNTGKYPDLVQTMKSFLSEGTKSFILDCEVVAYDRKANKILPFQQLSHRKRKDVAKEDVTIQVCLYAFDLLYYNDEPIIQKNFEERRKLLHSSFKATKGQFEFAHYKDSSDPEEIAAFLDLAVEQSCEGLMVKTLNKDATYEPSKRSMNWLKCKKDYLDGCGDSLDLVVMGAYFGTGKRVGVYGSYLVGCYNEAEETYETCCKVGTGFSDADLKSLHESLKDHLREKKPMEYNVTDFNCDVWFSPEQVWEIKCADLQISPRHTAGVGLAAPSKGIGLRFPRFLRLRDDKSPEDATTGEQVYEFYNNQAVIQNSGNFHAR